MCMSLIELGSCQCYDLSLFLAVGTEYEVDCAYGFKSIQTCEEKDAQKVDIINCLLCKTPS